MTTIEIEVGGKKVYEMRSAQVPAVGDSITISGPDKSAAPMMISGKSYAAEVKHRVWVKDKGGQFGEEVLRCVLICERVK